MPKTHALPRAKRSDSRSSECQPNRLVRTPLNRECPPLEIWSVDQCAHRAKPVRAFHALFRLPHVCPDLRSFNLRSSGRSQPYSRFGFYSIPSAGTSAAANQQQGSLSLLSRCGFGADGPVTQQFDAGPDTALLKDAAKEREPRS
jgi:hypothetical protein